MDHEKEALRFQRNQALDALAQMMAANAELRQLLIDKSKGTKVKKEKSNARK